ncbi:hypothetical protein ACWC5I_41255, partial [Kitasatospora sp. NPDC001574]
MLTAAVSFALTAAGVAVAGLRAYRRRFLSATRWFAFALVPAGLYLTGLFPVARTIGSELADWATKLAPIADKGPVSTLAHPTMTPARSA